MSGPAHTPNLKMVNCFLPFSPTLLFKILFSKHTLLSPLSLKIYKKDIIFMRKQTFSRALSLDKYSILLQSFFPPSPAHSIFSLSESVSRNRFRYRNFGRKMSFFYTYNTHSSANTHIYNLSVSYGK